MSRLAIAAAPAIPAAVSPRSSLRHVMASRNGTTNSSQSGFAQAARTVATPVVAANHRPPENAVGSGDAGVAGNACPASRVPRADLSTRQLADHSAIDENRKAVTLVPQALIDVANHPGH